MIKKTGALLMILWFLGQILVPGLLSPREACAGSEPAMAAGAADQDCCSTGPVEPATAPSNCCGSPRACHCHVKDNNRTERPVAALSTSSGHNRIYGRTGVLPAVLVEGANDQAVFLIIPRDWLPGPPLILRKSSLLI